VFIVIFYFEISTLVQVCCNGFAGGKRAKEGGSRRVRNPTSPAPSASAMLAPGSVNPRALEVTTTCSCVADGAGKETFTFPDGKAFVKREGIGKSVD